MRTAAVFVIRACLPWFSLVFVLMPAVIVWPCDSSYFSCPTRLHKAAVTGGIGRHIAARADACCLFNGAQSSKSKAPGALDHSPSSLRAGWSSGRRPSGQ